MKILQVINNLGSGGAEKLISDFAPLMKEQGNDVEICLLSQDKSIYINDLKNKGIKVHILSKKNNRSLFHIFNLRKLFKNGKYDVIHLHLFPALYYGVFANLFLKNKLFYTEHSTHNKRRDYYFFKLIEKFIYSKYEKVICISEKTKENLLNFLDYKNREKFIVIENGINLEKFYTSQKIPLKNIDSSLEEKDILITMVGRFSEQKDQITLIKAMKYLPENYKLLLVGEGDLKKLCEEEVLKLELEKKVIFLGIRKDIGNIFKTSHIAVLSSKWEGFGLVAVEAMATGIEVIGTNVDGLREVINNQENLFNVGDYKKLAEIILKKINSKSKNIQDLSKYDIKLMTKRYLEEYGEKI